MILTPVKGDSGVIELSEEYCTPKIKETRKAYAKLEKWSRIGKFDKSL